MWENMEPGADHEREDLVEELASMVSSMKAPLAQRTTEVSPMSLHTAAEGLKEVAIMWENLGPGADHEREDVVEDLASMVLSMKATLAQRKTEFSPMTTDGLHNLNVVPSIAQILLLKPGYMARVEGTSQSGIDKLWSSSDFHQHLKMLDNHVPYNASGASRWIEAFLFRVSAMVNPDRRMVLHVGNPIPSKDVDSSTPTTFSGFIGYIVAIASHATAQHFLTEPTLENISLTMPNAFFVAQAKLESVSLINHIPQAICEMYVCLKSLKKKFLRGALTSGHDWIFLIIELNADGDGATYQHSYPFEPHKREIGEMWPDLVTGILYYWVEHSFTGMQSDDNDWFEMCLPT